ncbi:hypothetical protein C8N40_111108 [Pontibacter mucosus]|uniref:Uncharacterized protein n=1 Tax=Pontibacter mucosus TaxID=1649266 RepID=A0A2T5YD71_9BACT|nr:hypothetical protein [Pontibacter mucosus]PTX14443.1 hypothetical protein C8N40_111108 [Pontibacter mucosus]
MNTLKHFNQLPKHFASWTGLLTWLKETKPELLQLQTIRIAEGRNEYEITIDYAKARAFEEIGELPNANALYCAAEAIRDPYNYDYSVKEFLERVLKLKGSRINL